TQMEYVVAEVIGLRERYVNGPGERGDFDRAGSSKFLDAVPVGMLPARGPGQFRFGVSVFPSLYADALYALDDELDRIFKTHARGATFVVFDVNGEYEAAFAPLAREGGIGVDRVVLDGTTGGFRLPHWFLDLSEWELLLQASERTQVPILRMALGLSTLFSQDTTDDLNGV